jgi:ribosome-binding protein aMBF1 (putative translation factor)
LTICTLELQAFWQPSKDYPSQPSRYGEHLRKGRLDLQLTQRELALILEVYESTIDKWERQGIIPQEHNQIKIKEFLGYDPLRKSNNFKNRNHEYIKK